MDLQQYAGAGGFPLVLALVELVKRTWPDLEARWYPLLALGFGISLSVGLAFLLGTDVGVAAATGLISGLTASGLFSGVKAGIVEPRQSDTAVARRIDRYVRHG